MIIGDEDSDHCQSERTNELNDKEELQAPTLAVKKVSIFKITNPFHSIFHFISLLI
jgi:hypothetical protein